MSDPIFQTGRIPSIPNIEIQKMEFNGIEWIYAIRNNYNPWASGWATEDDIIKEITKNKQTKIKS